MSTQVRQGLNLPILQVTSYSLSPIAMGDGVVSWYICSWEKSDTKGLVFDSFESTDDAVSDDMNQKIYILRKNLWIYKFDRVPLISDVG